MYVAIFVFFKSCALANIMSQKRSELCGEFGRTLLSVEYCLAPKKVSEKQGAANPRSGYEALHDVSEGGETPEQLDAHALKLYEWLDKSKVSRVLMLLHLPNLLGHN